LKSQVGRRRLRNIACVTDFNPRVPSIARVYDFLSGGKDNFAADREMAQRVIEAFPAVMELTMDNKQFLGRAVTWAAGEGVGQFIDIGCGLPTPPGTHHCAQAVLPGARVAYVDIDPIVLSHLHGLPSREQVGLTVVDADARDTCAVLDQVAAGLDLSAPACLVIAALLHFFPLATARELVARYAAALAPGSFVILTMGLADGPTSDRLYALYSQGPTRVYKHSAGDFASFFGNLPLVPPGVVDARAWRPGWPQVPVPPRRDVQVIAGVARIG
jgi:O-methyltransferase involved in polyketide biosynthesis